MSAGEPQYAWSYVTTTGTADANIYVTGTGFYRYGEPVTVYYDDNVYSAKLADFHRESYQSRLKRIVPRIQQLLTQHQENFSIIATKISLMEEPEY